MARSVDEDYLIDDFFHMLSNLEVAQVCSSRKERRGKKPINFPKEKLMALKEKDSDEEGDHNYCSLKAAGMQGFTREEISSAHDKITIVMDAELHAAFESDISSDEESPSDSKTCLKTNRSSSTRSLRSNLSTSAQAPVQTQPKPLPLFGFSSTPSPIFNTLHPSIPSQQKQPATLNFSSTPSPIHTPSEHRPLQPEFLQSLQLHPATPSNVINKPLDQHSVTRRYSASSWLSDSSLPDVQAVSPYHKSDDEDNYGSDYDCGASVAMSCVSGLVTDFEDGDGFDMDGDSDWYEPFESNFSSPGADGNSSSTLSSKGLQEVKPKKKISKFKTIITSLYGAIPGVEVGQTWPYRMLLADSGVHCPPKNAVHCGEDGAYSVLLCGQFSTKDSGKDFIFNGVAPRPGYGRRKTRHLEVSGKRHQEMCLGNLALHKSMKSGIPVRVVRGSSMKNNFSPSGGNKAYRYDGLYLVTKSWREKQYDGTWEYRFVFKEQEPPTINTPTTNNLVKAMPPSFLPSNLVPVNTNKKKGQISFSLTSIQGDKVPIVVLERITARHFMPRSAQRRLSYSKEKEEEERFEGNENVEEEGKELELGQCDLSSSVDSKYPDPLNPQSSSGTSSVEQEKHQIVESESQMSPHKTTNKLSSQYKNQTPNHKRKAESKCYVLRNKRALTRLAN